MRKFARPGQTRIRSYALRVLFAVIATNTEMAILRACMLYLDLSLLEAKAF